MKARISEHPIENEDGTEFNVEVSMPNGEFVFLHDPFASLSIAIGSMMQYGITLNHIECIMLETDEEESEDEVP